MSGRAPRMGWLPPFVVGASGAVAAEVSASLLLYDGVGLVRSLTTILAVEAGAFALGLWSAPGDGEDLIDRLRHRWVLCLVVFLTAAIFGTAWSLMAWPGATGWGQGLGLAVMGGMPLYAVGTVLGGLATSARTDPGHRLRMPGPAAAAGFAAGVLVTGVLLPKAPMPASLLVACLVMLSFGGMVFGTVLGARTQIDVRARRPGRTGEVRVEDRTLPDDDLAVRVLLEGDYVRRRVDLTGKSPDPWDVVVARALMPGEEERWHVLHIGGGASPVARTVLREHPVGVVDVAERTGAVIELGREHFDTELTISKGERCSVDVANLDDVLARVSQTYDLVLIDSLGLSPIGGVGGLSRAAMANVLAAVGSNGTVVWGPLPLEAGRPEVPDGWSHVEYVRDGVDGGLDEGEHVTLVRRGDELPNLPGVEGFSPALGVGAAPL